jgi:hypothetical protein
MKGMKVKDHDEYLLDAKHGGRGPSNAMRHDAADRPGQTISATGAVNNVGRATLNIENSFMDEHFRDAGTPST